MQILYSSIYYQIQVSESSIEPHAEMDVLNFNSITGSTNGISTDRQGVNWTSINSSWVPSTASKGWAVVKWTPMSRHWFLGLSNILVTDISDSCRRVQCSVPFWKIELSGCSVAKRLMWAVVVVFLDESSNLLPGFLRTGVLMQIDVVILQCPPEAFCDDCLRLDYLSSVSSSWLWMCVVIVGAQEFVDKWRKRHLSRVGPGGVSICAG